jgi:hypothetical protein
MTGKDLEVVTVYFKILPKDLPQKPQETLVGKAAFHVGNQTQDLLNTKEQTAVQTTAL